MAALLAGWTSEDAYYLALRGYRLFREGQLRDAAILFEGLAVIDPDNLYYRKALAAISLRLEQPAAAIAHLDAVLARNPFDVEARAGRCEAQLDLGDLDAALLDLDSLAAHPDGRDDARRLHLRLLNGAGAPQLPAPAPDNLYGC